MRWSRHAAVAGLAAFACGHSDRRGPAVARGDSAGIEIVESGAAAWPGGAGWTVALEPILALGAGETDSNQVFDRVVGALRLGDGLIAVASDNQIRYFDSTGTFLRVSGRTGGGPGEYRDLAWIGRLEDSLLAWDRGNFRLTVIGAQGEFRRSAPLGRPGWGFVNVVGLLPGPSLLATVQSRELVDGVRRDSLAYLRYSLDGGPPDTVARLPGPVFYTVVTRRPDGLPAFARSSLVPFSPMPRAVPSPRGFYFGPGEPYEIREYGGDGELRRLIRRPVRPAPLTADHHAEYRATYLASLRNDEARREIEDAWGKLPVARTAPSYGGITADDGGNLWVFPYSLPGDTGSASMVFDSGGVLLGPVTTPGGLFITQIGGDFLLGVWRGADDVEQVRLYRLHKPGA